MEKIKIGQIGIGHNHASAIWGTVQKFPDLFEVVGFAEPDEEWIRERGSLQEYQGMPRMTVEQLLNVPGLQAVSVETDVWNLVPTAQKCIDAGFHVHMDKPAGEDLGEYRRLLESAEKKNLAVQLGYMYRYNPAIQECMKMARNGEFGEIFSIDTMMSTQHSAEYRTWLKHFRGGSMYIFGCHLIDLILLFLGEPERVVPFQKQTGFDGVEVPDNGFAVLEYPNAIATVKTASNEVNGWGRRQFVICGQDASVEIKPLEKPTILSVTKKAMAEKDAYSDVRIQRQLPEPTGAYHNRYDEQILDFARIIRGEIENPYSYAHELLVQKVTLQACGFSNEELEKSLRGE